MMKIENLKEQVREKVRESVRENINTNQNSEQVDKNENNSETKQVNEGLELLVGAGAVGLYGYIRSKIKNKEQAKMLEQFIETYDKDNVMSRKIPDMFKRFKLVNSLSDLERLENELERYVSRLNFMIDKVDEFVESNYRDEKTKTDMFFLRNPESVKRKLKNNLRYVIESTKDDAELRFDQRRDEILTSE